MKIVICSRTATDTTDTTVTGEYGEYVNHYEYQVPTYYWWPSPTNYYYYYTDQCMHERVKELEEKIERLEKKIDALIEAHNEKEIEKLFDCEYVDFHVRRYKDGTITVEREEKK